MKVSRLCGMAIAAAVVVVGTGCASLATIEPISTPPVQYRVDATTDIEFLPPRSVGKRCAERGGKVFGMAAFSAMACANPQLVTMPDPCVSKFRTQYNNLLCETLTVKADQRTRTDANPSKSVSVLRVEFLRPALVRQRCLERGGMDTHPRGGQIVACRNAAMMTVANPCALNSPGWYARLLCHELGHVNGWPPNHSNAKRYKTAMQISSSYYGLDTEPNVFRTAVTEAMRAARERDPVEFIFGDETLL